MKAEQFRQISDTQFHLCKAVLEAKGNEYTEDSDVLSNFRQAAHLQKVSLREALAGMMAKHTVSIYDLIGGVGRVEADMWLEKITDHINYLVLLRAIIEEENPKVETTGVETLPFQLKDDYTSPTPIYDQYPIVTTVPVDVVSPSTYTPVP